MAGFAPALGACRAAGAGARGGEPPEASGVGGAAASGVGVIGVVDGARSGAGSLDAARAGAAAGAARRGPRRTVSPIRATILAAEESGSRVPNPAYRHSEPTDRDTKGNV